MEFRLLGTIEAVAGGRPINLGSRKQRLLLALLLLEANRPVELTRLTQLLWPDGAPPSARATTYTLMWRLREALAAAGAQRYGIEAVTIDLGYQLRTSPERIDVTHFRSLVEQARAAADDPTRVALLVRALAYWRGPALADAPPQVRERLSRRLDEEWFAANEDRFDAELRLGRHHAVVGELAELTALHPERERLIAQYVLALYRSGRTVDALAACRGAIRHLADEFGLDPGPQLRRLELDILRGGPAGSIAAAAWPAPVAVPVPRPGAGVSGDASSSVASLGVGQSEGGSSGTGAGPAGAQPTDTGPAGAGPPAAGGGPGGGPGPASGVPAGGAAPAQLPAAPYDFTGRAAELRWLRGLLVAPEPVPPGPVPRWPLVVAIVGPPGVGKTALALRWAHELADRFPGGQFYVDLRGSAADQPLAPLTALGSLLASMPAGPAAQPAEQAAEGTGRAAGPADLAAAAARYRSLLAGKPVLAVLDDAADAEQVRPLLPAAAGSLVLVTSRRRLDGLVVSDGARRLVLGPLTPPDARALLVRLLGTGRVGPEPVRTADAADQLARVCGCLPLALRAAAGLALRPGGSLAVQLADPATVDPVWVLDLAAADRSRVGAALDHSYQQLDPADRLLLRRLGLLSGRPVPLAAITALLPWSPDRVLRSVYRLAAAHLVEEPEPARYRVGALVTWHARRQSLREDTRRSRLAAVRRLLTWYFRRADAAARLLFPLQPRLQRGAGHAAGQAGAGRPAGQPGYRSPADALTWLDAEAGNLVWAVGLAAELGLRRLAWSLADAVRGYLALRRRLADWLATARTALAAAAGDGDRTGEATAQLSLGEVCLQLSRPAAAAEHAVRALGLSRQLRWPDGERAAATVVRLARRRRPAARRPLARPYCDARWYHPSGRTQPTLRPAGVARAAAGRCGCRHRLRPGSPPQFRCGRLPRRFCRSLRKSPR